MASESGASGEVEADKLRGKRVLVFGGETALGRALCIGLAKAGADIAIASLVSGSDAEFAVNSAANELWALGREGIALVIDASDPAQVREAVRQAERELGRLSVGVVVSEGVALDELRALLGQRPVVVLAADVTREDALQQVVDQL